MMNHLTYDFLFHALDLCRFLPIYQERVRAVTSIKDHLRQFGINPMERYTIDVYNEGDRKSVLEWARRCIAVQGQSRPHWMNFTMKWTTVAIASPSTWNLSLVNVQCHLRNHVWDLLPLLLRLESPFHSPPPDTAGTSTSSPDLIRYPANSKTRNPLLSPDPRESQRRACRKWLISSGINFDLVQNYKQRTRSGVLPYNYLSQAVGHGPACQISDLEHVGNLQNATITVEDKDPSVLWVVNGKPSTIFGSCSLSKPRRDGRLWLTAPKK